MRALVLVALVAVAGCFRDKPLNGSLKCNTMSARHCPSGYYCAPNNTCWLLHTGPNLDMTMSLPDMAGGTVDMKPAGADLASVDGGVVTGMMDMSVVLPPGWSFLPAHVSGASWIAGAPDVTLMTAGGNTIDTEARTVNGVTSSYFIADSGADHSYAVLSTGAFTVSTPITVTGKAALVIVATGAVMLQAPIHADANLGTSGPGAGDAMSLGAGGPGLHYVDPGGNKYQSGGGGGGFATTGGLGGSGIANDPPGSMGAVWATSPKQSVLFGGSPGGPGLSTLSNGGGGGGAVQISSALSITIVAAGGISVNGGGGNPGTSGGGGGAGGQIYLEAPSLSLAGTLAANGGGGGGANCPGCGGTPAVAGVNGSYGSGVANGGAGQAPMGGPGGNGAAGVMGSFSPATPGGNGNSFAGGGGGGAGYIWLHYPAASSPTVSGTISPPYGSDATLP